MGTGFMQRSVQRTRLVRMVLVGWLWCSRLRQRQHPCSSILAAAAAAAAAAAIGAVVWHMQMSACSTCALVGTVFANL